MSRSKKSCKAIRLIGIDPGGSFTGYCVLQASNALLKYIDSGVWDFTDNRHESSGMKLYRLERYLLNLIKQSSNFRTFLAFEKIRFHGENNGVDAPQVYGEVTGTIKKVCHEYEIEHRGIHLSTARKIATGHGNIGKPEAREFLEDLFDVRLDHGDKKVRKKIKKAFDESDAGIITLAFAKDLGWDVQER